MSCACPCPGTGPAERPWPSVDLQGLRRLGLVRMVGSGIDLELRQLLAGEAVAGKHPLDRLADHLGRPALQLIAKWPALEAAGIAGMAVVELVVELVAGDMDLFGVNDDDEVARIDVRRVLRLRLAAQRVGDLGRQAAQGLPLGVDEVPAALDLAGLCSPGLRHGNGGP